MGTTQEIEAYDRPWGWYQIVYSDENYWTKIVYLAPGHAISLHLHYSRTEHLTPLDGGGKIIMNGSGALDLLPGLRYTVSPRLLHRLYNPTDHVIRFVEVGVGQLNETDIVRVNDKYGR